MTNLVTKNIFWLSFSRISALVMLFFAYTQLFRYLGPEIYGQYQFVLSYVMLFSTVVDFGIQQFIQKKISEEPAKTKKYFQDFLNFEIFAAGFLFGALILIAYLNSYPREIFYGILVAGFGMSINALCYPYLAVMSAFQDLKKVALINFINSFVNITIIFLAIWLKFEIVFLAAIQLVFGAVDLILYKVFTKKYLKNNQQPYQFRGFFVDIVGILKKGWPFVLLVGFSSIYNRIDMVIISHLKGFEQTGYYAAAYKLFDLLAFFPAIVSHALYPFFAASVAKNLFFEIKETLEKYLRLMFLLALPMAVGGTLLSEGLIKLIAGPEYLSAAPVFAILIWAAALLFMYIPLNAFVISQFTKKAAFITGVNVFLNIAGNLFFMGYLGYGIWSAAVMTILSELLQGAFYFYLVKTKLNGLVFKKNFWPPFFASAGMGVILYFLKPANLVFGLLTGGFTYLILLFLMGYIKKTDILFIQSFISLKKHD